MLARALADLAVAPAERTETTFFLRPYTVEELACLTDDELPRYLYLNRPESTGGFALT